VKHVLWIGLALLALGTVNRGIDAWTTREQAYFLLEERKVELEEKMFERITKT
jgi:hypothetical protein